MAMPSNKAGKAPVANPIENPGESAPPGGDTNILLLKDHVNGVQLIREARHRAERRRHQPTARESRKQLRNLSVHLQRAREQERTRIAREVHDVLGQALTGLKLQLTWLTSRLPRNLKGLHRKARVMGQYIDKTIETARRIATELRPGVLDNAGLLAAIEWQSGRFEKLTGIRCRVEADMNELLFNPERNTAFFRILQESLTNITRHAAATEVDVKLARTGNQLVLKITDNGRGISDEQTQNIESIGLLGMRERAALLGGELRVSGRKNKGTTVSVRIPYPVSGTR